jgi:hypothetical protein
MAEIVDRDVVLKMLRGFTPLQCVLLTTAGTRQGTLSAFFGTPVTIELVHQQLVIRNVLRARALDWGQIEGFEIRRLTAGWTAPICYGLPGGVIRVRRHGGHSFNIYATQAPYPKGFAPSRRLLDIYESLMVTLKERRGLENL